MSDITPPPPPGDRPAQQQPPSALGSQSPAVTPGGGALAQPYPIDIQADYPPHIARWRPLLHWLLAIPHLIVLFFVGIAAYFAFVAAWFAIVFTRRYPEALFNFVAGTLRWGTRVGAYYLFLLEPYPPFSLDEEPGYPLRVRFDYPSGGIARWRPFLQWLLAIPQFIVLSIVGLVAYLAIIVSWFAVLITGTYPEAIWKFVIGFLRWQTRVNAYAYLMTEKYPPFALD